MADLVAYSTFTHLNRHSGNQFGWSWYQAYLPQREDSVGQKQLGGVSQKAPPVHVCGAGPLIQYAATRPSLQGNVLAAVIGVVLFVLTALTQGACYDSPDPAARCARSECW